MKKQMQTVLTFTKLNTRRFFRDRLALFFTVIFPLIFLFIFGSFSKGGSLSFKVAVINQSSSSYSQDYVKSIRDNKLIKVDDTITTLDKAKEKMKRSEVDATIILPADFGEIKGQSRL